MEETRSTEELFGQLQEVWDQFDSNHKLFVEKGNKSAASRARKALGEFKKLVTPYRKSSIEDVKKL